MKKKEAIDCLNSLYPKLIGRIGFEVKDAWINQTRSIVKQFFGPDSDEYRFIRDFNLDAGVYNTQAQIAKEFLINCAETIEIKGLYKAPNTNIVSKWDNWQILTALSAIVVTCISIGIWAGDTKARLEFQEKIHNKTASELTLDSTLLLAVKQKNDKHP